MPRPIVLVVDDDIGARDAEREALEQAGVSAVAVSDGRMALDYLRSQPLPDLILLDVVMPGMDGFQFRNALLEDARWARIPTLVITADRMAVPRWADAEVAGFLTKPVHAHALIAEVTRVLQESSAGTVPPTRTAGNRVAEQPVAP